MHIVHVFVELACAQPDSESELSTLVTPTNSSTLDVSEPEDARVVGAAARRELTLCLSHAEAISTLSSCVFNDHKYFYVCQRCPRLVLVMACY